MSNLTQEERSIMDKEIQYWKEMKASLERLHENEDFKKVILEGYFKDKAINGVSMLAQDYIIRNGKRTEVMEALIAISHLQDYFITIENMTNTSDDEDYDDLLETTEEG